MPGSGFNRTQNVQPGLLPWQKLFLYFLLGLFAYAQPWVSIFCAALLFTLQRNLFLGPGPGLFQAVFFFALGLFLQFSFFPGPDIQVMHWMQNREMVNIEGRILQVEPKQSGRLQIVLDDVNFKLDNDEQGQLPSRLLWNWYDAPSIWPAPGQEVSGSFRIRPIKGYINPGGKDNRFYWRGQQIKYRTYTSGQDHDLSFQNPPGFFWDLRQDLRQNILDKTREGPARGLLLALLMGDRTHLEQGTMDLIRSSSLAHSLALSGLHLGFMAGLGWALAWLAGRIQPRIYLRWPRPKLAVYSAAPLILTYVWLGQAKPSLLRAALMFFFWGLLLLLGRDKKLLDGLFFAVLVIVLINPAAIFELSLQLSVLAVCGIILAWPVFFRYFQSWQHSGWQGKIIFFTLSILLVTLVANAALLPLLSHYFGELSPHLYLNLFWLPLLGWVVLPLGLLALGSSLLPGLEPISQLLFSMSAWTLDSMLAVLTALQNQNWLQTMVLARPLWPAMLGYWLLLVLFIVFFPRNKKAPLPVVCAALLLLLLPVAFQEWQAARPAVRLSLLDVGHGQAAYIQAPNGQRLLVDGGGSWNPDFDFGRYVLGPVLTRNKPPSLDKVLLSHGHYDHYRGLYYPLRRYTVHNFMYNGFWPRSSSDKALLQDILQKQEITQARLNKGRNIKLGPDLYLQVLHPPAGWTPEKVNDKSLVLRLVHKDQGLFLLPGDIEQAALDILLEDQSLDLQSQVLVLPHHGSRTSISPELLQRVNPELALVSCGYLHHFNLPHPEVKQSVQEQNIPLYSTALNGALEIRWNLRQNSMQFSKMLEQ